ncbi:MAG: outer membrane protein transport protein, partial [Nitrosospira sp.]
LLPFLMMGSISISSSAIASGFALQNQNGAGTGYAYAGAAAVAQDASTIYFNPAGMTYLAPGHHVSGALNLLVRSLKFNDTGSGALLPYPLGDNGGQAGGLAVIPAVYWTMPVTSALRLGLGISPTFGSSTEWSNTFVGRYQGVFSEISAINFNPSVAWRVNDAISLGLGFNVVRFEADLRSMSPVKALLPALVDAETKITGNDIGFGYNLGVMFQLAPATRMGLTYRSGVNLKVDGHLEIPGNTIRASVPVELPDTASVAVSHMINNRLQLLGDLTWTGWSSIPALVVNSRASGSVLSNERLGLKDSYRVGLGAQYQYSEKLQLRVGAAYDQSPTRNATDRTVRLPDSDRIWLALGFNQKINEKTSIDVGYAHLFLDKAEINRATNNNPLLQVVRGSFNTSVDIISVQLNHRF